MTETPGRDHLSTGAVDGRALPDSWIPETSGISRTSTYVLNSSQFETKCPKYPKHAVCTAKLQKKLEEERKPRQNRVSVLIAPKGDCHEPDPTSQDHLTGCSTLGIR
jgi:hypothetical protein